MADVFDSLTSGAPTDPQQQQALAAALRRQSMLGQVGAATGDRVLAPLGEGLQASALKSGQDIAGERQHQMALQQAMEFHKQAQEEAAQRDATSRRGQDMTDARMRDLLTQRDQDAADRQADRLAAAKDKAEQGKPLPVGAGKDIEQTLDAMRGVDATLLQAKTLDAQGKPLGGMGRNAKNWLAANTPFATQDVDDVQNFWGNYGRQFTLPELKNTIGVRHNEYMQNLFESYHINPNMANDQIVKNLQQISDQLHARVSSRANDFASQGYNVGAYSDLIAGKDGSAAAPIPTAADKYRAAAKAPPPAPAAPPAPGAPPMALPQAMGAQPQQPRQLPMVPGFDPRASLIAGFGPNAPPP